MHYYSVFKDQPNLRRTTIMPLAANHVNTARAKTHDADGIESVANPSATRRGMKLNSTRANAQVAPARKSNFVHSPRERCSNASRDQALRGNVTVSAF